MVTDRKEESPKSRHKSQRPTRSPTQESHKKAKLIDIYAEDLVQVWNYNWKMTFSFKHNRCFVKLSSWVWKWTMSPIDLCVKRLVPMFIPLESGVDHKEVWPCERAWSSLWDHSVSCLVVITPLFIRWVVYSTTSSCFDYHLLQRFKAMRLLDLGLKLKSHMRNKPFSL